MEQPTFLTLVKVVPRGLTVRELYAIDPEGNVWWRTDGFRLTPWKLHKKAEELDK
jgi:hypothetical protein